MVLGYGAQLGCWGEYEIEVKKNIQWRFQIAHTVMRSSTIPCFPSMPETDVIELLFFLLLNFQKRIWRQFFNGMWWAYSIRPLYPITISTSNRSRRHGRNANRNNYNKIFMIFGLSVCMYWAGSLPRYWRVSHESDRRCKGEIYACSVLKWKSEITLFKARRIHSSAQVFNEHNESIICSFQPTTSFLLNLANDLNMGLMTLLRLPFENTLPRWPGSRWHWEQPYRASS